MSNEYIYLVYRESKSTLKLEWFEDAGKLGLTSRIHFSPTIHRIFGASVISNMITFVSPNFVYRETTRDDLMIAAIAWGFTLGFGFLTTHTALKQTTQIAKRYGITRLNQPYIWMIWLEIIDCFFYGILCWLYLIYKIPPRSVISFPNQ